MAKKRFSINSNLADAMNETVSAAKNNAGDLRVEIIPLNKICLDEENPRELALSIDDLVSGIQSDDPLKKRKQQDKEGLLSLSKSINEQGIINPVVVYKEGTSYKLIAGERRTLASFIAKKTDIPAKVLNAKPDPLKLSLLQWIENIERQDLTLGEKIVNLNKIIDCYCKEHSTTSATIRVEDLSELLGCSTPLASHYRAVINASAPLIEAIKQGQINNLKKAALIARAPKDMQEMLIIECIKGATEKRLKEIISELDKKFIKPSDVPQRGKTTTQFKLGSTTNPTVAKVILESLLLNPRFENFKKNIDLKSFNEPRYANKVFNELIKSLEEA
jgi:ParB family chromosome partitioning protein